MSAFVEQAYITSERRLPVLSGSIALAIHARFKQNLVQANDCELLEAQASVERSMSMSNLTLFVLKQSGVIYEQDLFEDPWCKRHSADF